MSQNREEILAAWLDGTLAPEQRASFEAEMAGDPELAAQAARWQANDARMAAAFAPIADLPIDPAMRERLGLAPTAPPSAVVAIPPAANDNPPWWRRHALPLGGALVASLLAVMLLVPRSVQQPQDPVSLALETAAPLSQVRLADGRVIQPVLTVRAADGRYCREFRLPGTVGLACRDKGSWTIEAQGPGDGVASPDEIGLAAGADSSALEAAYRRIGASDPLDAASEAALLGKGWDDR